MRRQPILTGAGPALVATAAVTAGAVLGQDTHDPAADAAALERTIAPASASYVRNYTKLVEILPNAKHTADGRATSDSVVVGTVTDVVKDTGVVTIQQPSSGNVVRFTQQPVPFDSPVAEWRNLKVTISVSDVVAGPAVTTLVLDWGGRDPPPRARTLTPSHGHSRASAPSCCSPGRSRTTG